MRWSAEKGFFVENLFVIDCDVLDDCLAILEEGNAVWVEEGIKLRVVNRPPKPDHGLTSSQ